MRARVSPCLENTHSLTTVAGREGVSATGGPTTAMNELQAGLHVPWNPCGSRFWGVSLCARA